MTQRKAKIIKAKAQRESLSATANLVKNYAIFTLDLDGNITTWDEGSVNIKDWVKSEVLGKHFRFLYQKKDQEKYLPEQNLDEARVKGTYTGQGYRIKKYGEIFLADITISQIHDQKTGEHIGYFEIVKDITEQRQQETNQLDANDLLKQEIKRRKEIEKALKESNAELEAFASAASHDLQEPLRMVISYLQLIERRYKKLFDKDGKEFLEFAVDGATRMRILISDLVEYSRIDTLKKPYRITNLNKLLEEVLSNLMVSTGEANVKITYDPLPEVIGDAVQLSQLFQNLIANAIKFSDKKPRRVHIGVDRQEAEYVFRVEDNGRGINKKDFDKVFLIFKQLGTRSNRQGSGIGLALAKKIVKRHHGKIWVESTEGKGSTFYFTIPNNHTKQGG